MLNTLLTKIKSNGFVKNSYSYLFSPRPGTPAAEKNRNNIDVSKKRLERLQSNLEILNREYNENSLNKECEVLVENKLSNQSKYFGRTKYMTPVFFEAENCAPGMLINVKITSYNQNSLFGFYSTDKEKAA